MQTTLEGHLCHALAAQPELKPSQGRNHPISSRQRALRRRATISDEHHALSPEPPPCCSQCVTYAMWRLSSPTASRLGPCSARFASSGQASPPSSAPATVRRRPMRPTRPGHSIRSLRPRLDPTLTKSWPSDPDLTAVIRAYRFGLVHLLKSPPGSEYSTHSPPPLKNNYSLAQNFAQTPLSFLNIKPAVQHSFFYALDPRFIL